MVTTLVIMFVFALNGIIIERSTCTEQNKEYLFYLALVICIMGQLLLMCTALVDSGTLVPRPGDEECESLVGSNKGRKDTVPYCDSCMIYQINNAAHCTFCDCCVEELDHHCKLCDVTRDEYIAIFIKCTLFISNLP